MKKKSNDIVYLKALLYCLNRGCQLFGHSDDYSSLYLKLCTQFSELGGMDLQNFGTIASIENKAFGDIKIGNGQLSLHSIFSSIGIDGFDKSIINGYIAATTSPEEMTKEGYFPISEASTQMDMERLWKTLVEKLLTLSANTPLLWTENALTLLQIYTVSLPFSLEHVDTSFYDWTRVIMAMAACESEEYTLVGGDISGIQNYIYNITSKYASKSLKGRSFYIRLLTDAVVRNILDGLGLFRANIVYCSGGGFYILAPRGIETVVLGLVEKIEKNIFLKHGTQLFVAIGAVSLSFDHLSDSWNELFYQLKAKKQVRFAHFINNNPQYFFEAFEQKKGLRDSITGEPFSSDEEEFPIGQLGHGYKDVEGWHIRPLTGIQILLGEWLSKYQIMLVSTEYINKRSVEVAQLGYYYTLMNEADLSRLNLPGGTSCIYFNQLKKKNHRDDVIYQLEYYGGNMYYSHSDFDKMCDSDTELRRLGVLRMDVDNLGSIFQQGLGSKVSLARYATLSRNFDFFFSGYINAIHKAYKESTFVIYSGGDDLCIVGDWNSITEFASKIREDFRQFTSNSPSLSISGGITFIPAKFPIIKGVELSAEEEDRAKKYKYKERSKDAISLLGLPISWTYEYPKIIQVIKALKSLLECEDLTRSFLSKVMKINAMAVLKDHKVTNYAFYWMASYDLGRLRGSLKSIEAQELISKCIMDICDTQYKMFMGEPIDSTYHPLELWALACRYTELLTRKEND